MSGLLWHFNIFVHPAGILCHHPVMSITGNARVFESLRVDFQQFPPPVILFNKSHSGSRLLAELVEAGGFFLGAHQNDSRDSIDMVKLVEYLVCNYYPDYSPLWSGNTPPDHHLAELIKKTFAAHLEGHSIGAPWGWKLCETLYILPVLDFLFPEARYIHLLRDGRDVAFCDHTAPRTPFWKKIYFNTDRIRTWRTFPLSTAQYKKTSHIFNALHWVNSVTVGCTYGAMLRDRYIEVRYEDLCAHFEPTATRVLNFLNSSKTEEGISACLPKVHTQSIAKHLQKPKKLIREILDIEKPLLLTLGYLESDPFTPLVPAITDQLKKSLRL
jgi:hypothetical protein